ncbi:MAG TPA: lipoprotein signal peptidase [Prolixibacteraceae bacterium]|nr:lipoprotein signal peptidase [Prolixibacteraceae bacterium]
MKWSKLSLSLIIVMTVIVADQVLKFWIKTHMMLGQEFPVLGDWFIIHFVENNGMAFGFELAGEYGKMILSLFRILAVIAIGWYLFRLVRQETPPGVVVSLSLIFAGAIGNIIDSAFYGMIFDHSFGQVASFLPEGGGYGTFLHGKVVDMFYFPVLRGQYPQWVPFLGGNEFLFFRPVFNIADSAITIGIFSVLLFYRNFFNDHPAEEKERPAKGAPGTTEIPQDRETLHEDGNLYEDENLHEDGTIHISETEDPVPSGTPREQQDGEGTPDAVNEPAAPFRSE